MNKPQLNSRPAQLVLSRGALVHNLNTAKRCAPNAKVMAVIKADAYGHGMMFAAQSLDAADEFAVSSIDDVRQLRLKGIKKRITVLSGLFSPQELNSLESLNVRPTIFDLKQIDDYQVLNHTADLSVWLKVDTGMGRLGIAPDELGHALKKIRSIKAIKKVSLMSHLANADQPEHPLNEQQIEIFERAIAQGDFYQISLLNSAGCIAFSNELKSPIEMVIRPGLMLYGISPTQKKTAEQLDLQAVMTFKSQLISVKTLPSGSAIGYASEYVLEQETRVGIVSCGYGDGYPRHASTGTPVYINGRVVPLIGRVSMDMIAVDLSSDPAEVGDADEVGDEVILWGPTNPIEQVAHAAHTIAYELTCGITARVERVIV